MFISQPIKIDIGEIKLSHRGNRDTFRRDITVSQPIEIAVRIDITVLLSIETAFMTNVTVSMLRGIALGET